MLNYRTQASAHPQTRKTPKGQPTQWFSPRKGNSGSYEQQKALSDYSSRTCYKCGELSHISWQCDKPDEPMPTADSSGSQQTNLFAALMGDTNFPAMACPVTINSQDVEALLDSGSMITLIDKSLVNPAEIFQENTILVSCVHGDNHTYPTADLTIITTKGKCDVKAGVAATLPVSVLIGRDCPLFHALWQDILGKKMRETQRPRVQTRAEPRGVPEETETASENESSQGSVGESGSKAETGNNKRTIWYGTAK